MNISHHSQPTTTKQPFREPSSRYCLLLLAENVYATHPLPDSGSVVIGRSGSNDIFLDHESISRRHAEIHIGATVTIEDLGSTNGTRVRKELVEPGRRVELHPGEVVELGSVFLFVQQRGEQAQRRRLWSHEYFEARVEEECARARSGETLACAFSVIHIRTAPANAALVEDTLALELRPSDIIAAYAPGRYQVLVCGVDSEHAQQLCGRIAKTAALKTAAIEIGIAAYPHDGHDPDSLITLSADRASGDAEHGMTLIARNGQMQALGQLAERIARGQISVLIEGETGVGKEVMAETIHRLSLRADKPFLRLNCAALTETLLESELFGHERGAFTGALQAKPGLLETADGGTVFLDEIGELPLQTQVKLLRVLEERMVMRVGALKAKPIDVRFIAATNRDLEAEIDRGTFRRDLYFRLNGISLTIPPLRERVSEIRGLAKSFVARACRQSNRPDVELAPEVMTLLEHHSWPGNIRELRNLMERAVLLCNGSLITLAQLPVEKLVAVRPAQPVVAEPAPASPEVAAPLDFTREVRALERDRIVDALTATGGNQSEAAKRLGISRRTLLTKLDLHGLPRPRKRT